MTRQEANKEIVGILKARYPNYAEALAFTKDCIEAYPDQRFGQIICNYVCWDYRDSTQTDFSKSMMNDLFPGNPDPFFEESTVTLKRLTSK